MHVKTIPLFIQEKRMHERHCSPKSGSDSMMHLSTRKSRIRLVVRFLEVLIINGQCQCQQTAWPYYICRRETSGKLSWDTPVKDLSSPPAEKTDTTNTR